MTELSDIQRAFTAHLRDPDHVPVPKGVDARRMGIYSDLIYNNVSSLLGDFFPVIRSLLTEDEWHGMVRHFFISHQSQTPYFMELAGEFAAYLSHNQMTGELPAFLPELAHYEWIELAIFAMDEELPDAALPEQRLGETGLLLTPLAKPLAYQYPVHRIGPGYRPDEPGDLPTCLMVFRDAEEDVRFLELQPLSYHLMNEIEQNPGLVPGEWLSRMASDMAVEDIDSFVANGMSLLQTLNRERLLTEGQMHDQHIEQDPAPA